MLNKKIVANLKMNLTARETKEYLEAIHGKIQNKNVIICPSDLFIPYFLKGDYEVGIQNISAYEKGSYTGDVSALQAKSLGVNYVLLGHSERRIYVKETNDEIAKKIEMALKNFLHIILCIGETERERLAHLTEEVLEKQIIYALEKVEKQSLSNITLAYEPTWSIGSGKILEEIEIEKTIDFIKEVVKRKYDTASIEVLYGGSVNTDNINKLNQIHNIDGFLIGEASTNPETFLKIIEVAVIV